MNSCQNCHRLDPPTGLFGTEGLSTDELIEPQAFKIPQLRNLYQKIGMFGMPVVVSINSGDNGFTGDQIRGFGFMHDGSVDSVKRFLRSIIFTFPGGDAQRTDVASFLLAFEGELAPIVGQQVTLTPSTFPTAGPRIDLLVARASVVQPRRERMSSISGEARERTSYKESYVNSPDPLMLENEVRIAPSGTKARPARNRSERSTHETRTAPDVSLSGACIDVCATGAVVPHAGFCAGSPVNRRPYGDRAGVRATRTMSRRSDQRSAERAGIAACENP